VADGILTLSDATFDESIGSAETPILAKLNVDENPNIARRFDVMSIPTLLVFADGEVKKRLVGAKGKAQLLEELSEFIG
jgi:thioredoxin 1